MRVGRPPASPPLLSPQADAWLEAQIAERNISHNTFLAYRSDIAHVENTLRSLGVCLMTASQADLQACLNGATKSIARRLSSLRGFYNFAISEGWLTASPINRFESRVREKTLPDILSISEIEALIAATDHLPNGEGLRARLMLELLYGGGLRVSELIGLTRGDADPEHRTLHLHGKGGVERHVPLHARAWNILEQCLQIQPDGKPDQKPASPMGTSSKLTHKSADSLFIFPSRSSDSGHISRQRVGQILKQLAGFAGIDKPRVYPHCLRHSFATHLVDGGADLRSVQHLLGHARIGTTEIYTHVATSRLNRAVMTHHPMAKRHASKP